MGHPAEKAAPHPVLGVEAAPSYVEALRTERDGYLARGLTDRAKEVEDVLASLDADMVAPVQEPPLEATDEEPLPEKATPAKPSRARAKK